MSLWNGLGSLVECDRSLADLSSMRTCGAARYFCCPRNTDDLGEILVRCADNGIDARFVGGVSNVIVVSDVVNAMVIRVHSPGMTTLEFEDLWSFLGQCHGVRSPRRVGQRAQLGRIGRLPRVCR